MLEGLEWIGGGDAGDGGHWRGCLMGGADWKKLSHARASGARRIAFTGSHVCRFYLWFPFVHSRFLTFYGSNIAARLDSTHGICVSEYLSIPEARLTFQVVIYSYLCKSQNTHISRTIGSLLQSFEGVLMKSRQSVRRFLSSFDESWTTLGVLPTKF